MPLCLCAKRPSPKRLQGYENLILPVTEANKQIDVKSGSRMSLSLAAAAFHTLYVVSIW